MCDIAEQVTPGQIAFNGLTLQYYDRLLEFMCNRVWRCPIARTLGHYQRHLSSSHLEVGVGTGYFLDRSRFPAPQPRLALLDINSDCLKQSATKLSRYAPEIYHANALAPIKLDARLFDSIAINYVLHCMPGTFSEKGVVFTHLKSLLKSGGVLFGSTVLRREVPCDVRARAFMSFYNAYGVFSNLQDGLASLRQALEKDFRNVHIEVIGCIAQFYATT